MDREQLAGHQLSMEDLDQVAGGTHKEDFAIFQAIKKKQSVFGGHQSELRRQQ